MCYLPFSILPTTQVIASDILFVYTYIQLVEAFFHFDFKLYSTFKLSLISWVSRYFINVFQDSQIYMESMHLLYNHDNNNNTVYTTTKPFIPDTFSIFQAVRRSIRETREKRIRWSDIPLYSLYFLEFPRPHS